MGKEIVTYKELAAVRKDITDMCKKHPSYRVFHKQKIDDFFNRNSIRLNLLDKKLNKLHKKYVKTDEAGLLKTIQKEDGNYYDFIDDDAQKSFSAEYHEMMAFQIDMFT